MASNISTIPNEILAKILGFAMARDTPVHLQHFIDLGRTAHPKEPAYDDRDGDYQSCPYVMPPDWWLSQLAASQKRHFLHWILINGTCQRFRLIGKPAFFREKIFIITELFLRDLQAGKVRRLSAADTAMAFRWITHVVAPFKVTGAAGQYLGLVHYQRVLPHLRILDIMPRVEQGILSTLESWTKTAQKPPEILFDLLGRIGLDTNRICVRFVHSESETAGIMYQLQGQVYPYLQIVTDRRAKAKP